MQWQMYSRRANLDKSLDLSSGMPVSLSHLLQCGLQGLACATVPVGPLCFLFRLKGCKSVEWRERTLNRWDSNGSGKRRQVTFIRIWGERMFW